MKKARFKVDPLRMLLLYSVQEKFYNSFNGLFN